jgi:hypothetical protein
MARENFHRITSGSVTGSYEQGIKPNVAIFWDITPCSPYVNRRFGTTHHHLKGRKSADEEISV